MPNYDFHCENCQHEYELIIPSEDRDKKQKCPACGKKKVTRGVSAVKINYGGFKENLGRAGNGWNDLLNKVKKGSARSNTIKTK